jgi:hypothetical protein
MSRSIRALLLICSIFAASTSEAKRVFIDFGEGGFPNSGNVWDLDQSVFGVPLAGNQSTAPIALGFSIDVAGVSYDSIILNENGSVTFGAALSTSFIATTDLSTLGVPIIAPYYADLEPGDFGQISYTRGVADPRAVGGSYSLAETVPAFHVTWAAMTADGTEGLYTDLVIYSLGSDGSFAIQLGHGDAFNPPLPGEPDIPALGGVTGFALGDRVVNLTGARFGDQEDLYYEFRAAPPVPEPAGILAFAVGLGVLALAKRRFD